MTDEESRHPIQRAMDLALASDRHMFYGSGMRAGKLYYEQMMNDLSRRRLEALVQRDIQDHHADAVRYVVDHIWSDRRQTMGVPFKQCTFKLVPTSIEKSEDKRSMMVQYTREEDGRQRVEFAIHDSKGKLMGAIDLSACDVDHVAKQIQNFANAIDANVPRVGGGVAAMSASMLRGAVT